MVHLSCPVKLVVEIRIVASNLETGQIPSVNRRAVLYPVFALRLFSCATVAVVFISFDARLLRYTMVLDYSLLLVKVQVDRGTICLVYVSHYLCLRVFVVILVRTGCSPQEKRRGVRHEDAATRKARGLPQGQLERLSLDIYSCLALPAILPRWR